VTRPVPSGLPWRQIEAMIESFIAKGTGRRTTA